jgi:hypothetical protein
VSGLWTALSKEFVYGTGHLERPILDYLGLYWVAWGAFLYSVLALFRGREKPSLMAVLTIAFVARAFLLPSNLIQENDVYRYVLDGQAILHGQNPFEHSPLILPEMASENLRSSLQNPAAQLVLGRVGYPGIPTIYPPVGQLAFVAGAALCGWDWMGQRIVFLTVDLFVILTLISVLRRFALPACWVMLYAWNPLVLKEIVNSAHLDVLVALLTILLLLTLVNYNKRGSLLWLSFSAAVLGLAILTKFYPGLLIPTCSVYLYRTAGMRRTIQFVATAAGVIVLGYLPFLSIDLCKLMAGLSTYAQQWKMNDGFFSIVSTLFPAPRIVAALLILGLSVLVPLLKDTRSVENVASSFQWVFLFWYLMIPTPFPWYAVAVVALAVTRPFSIGTIATVVLSGVTSTYYLSFFYEYNDYPSGWWVWTRAVEHTLIWASMLLGWVLQKSRS